MFNTYITIAILLFVYVIGYILILRWVYTDAKAIGMKTTPWIILIILTSGNFIGLLIYAVIRSSHIKKISEISCNNCHSIIPVNSNFCPNCGKINDANKQIIKKKPSNRVLITGLAMVIISIVFILMLLINTLSLANHYSIASIENNKWKSAWNKKFYLFNGTQNYTFKVNNESNIFVYSSEITGGSIHFELYDPTGKLFKIILPNTSDTLRNLQNNAEYKLVAKADKAKGNFSFKMIGNK